jgi:Tfp pilus assembly PilM family ATPase
MRSARHRRGTGIHLAEDALYVVQFSHGRSAIALEAAVREAMPCLFAPSHLASDELRLELAEFLRQVSRQYGLRYENPCLSLDRRATLLKRRPVIQGPPKASREQMRWEAEQFLTSGAEEYGMGFWWTRRYGFVVAARRRILDLYLELCSEAGIGTPRFDLEPFALGNAAEAAGVLDDRAGGLLLELCAWGAHVVLLREGELEGASSCCWGDGEEARGEVLADCVQALLEEAGDPGPPARIWLSGAEVGSDTGAREWAREVESRLSVASALLDPFAGVGADQMAHGAAYAVAAGLAYRALSGR